MVDDNTDAAESIAVLLRLWGHAVRVAYNGPEALQAAQEYQPEVALLDIGLPGMDGYEVARRLRQQPSFHGTVLAAVTGYGQEEDLRRSKGAGFATAARGVAPASFHRGPPLPARLSLRPFAPSLRRGDAAHGLEFAVTEGLKYNDFPFAQVTELFARRVLQVRLMADDDEVLASRGRRREQDGGIYRAAGGTAARARYGVRICLPPRTAP